MMKKVMQSIKALTIRNLPEEVADAVRKKAEEGHLSLSKALVVLLEEHIAEQKPGSRKKRDLSRFVGTWTEEDAQAFDTVLRDQRRIDPKMWE